MDAAKLKIDFKKREGIDTEGFDDIEFLISTNVGQNLKPLSKIAWVEVLELCCFESNFF